MQEKKPEHSPAEIAREAFKRLAVRRIVPTPDAYREIYEEIAGTASQPSAEKVLADFASSLANASSEVSHFSAHFRKALENRDWQAYSRELGELVDKHLKQMNALADGATQKTQVQAAAPATAQKPNPIPLVDPIEPAPARPLPISLVDDIEPPAMKSRGIALIDDDQLLPAVAKAGKADKTLPPVVGETRQMQMLRDLLVRTLTLAVGSLLRNAPVLATEAEDLAESIRVSATEQDLNEVSHRLKQLCFKIELKAEDMAEEHELLLRLFKLLLENVGELLEDDSWLSGQIASVMDLLSGPISYSALLDATRSLKEVIYKQSLLKHSLTEAKATVKNMMITFIDRLGTVVASTDAYHQKMDQYASKISQAKGIGELNKILQDVMHDTRIAQAEAERSRDAMVTARQEVQDAEVRIHELEKQLEHLSELVREDQLTGSLNRRGLDEVLERETSRAARRKAPLCVALLDLDDFKKLNDTHGHTAGDHALIHLVKVVKDTLRAMDIIARFGGEEFMVVLPETPLEEAMQTVTRVQRELTKQIFMYNNQRLLITFSAGVALHVPGESQEDMIKRADEALYKAKKAGKNRVVAAE